MDDAAIGRSLFLLRARQRLRQADLGEVAGVSQDEISLVERGHIAQIPLGTLRRVFEAAGASLISDVRWRGGELDRLRDARHAGLVSGFVRVAGGSGWPSIPEVTYSEFGERGSIDLLCMNEPALAIAVTEMKSGLASIEAMVRKLDEKARLAPTLMFRQFGWRPRVVGRILVLPDTSTARRQVAAASELLDPALPARTIELRAWMKRPTTPIAGIWFLADTTGSRTTERSTTQRRVRRRSDGPG
ncbi:MAG: helix-turn-helix domain-containing protein [Chloroflexi bacterium]|nr:helix-turn-helix domain-containing protein [Chloroflexota bacterium]